MKTFEQEINLRREKIYHYLRGRKERNKFAPEDIHEAVYSYLNKGGKALRSTLMLFTCGAVGGKEACAIPAGAAVEVYHTWTLIHDDIIDHDSKRRGRPTVHEEFRIKGEKVWGLSSAGAKDYGMAVAILAGDVQQGWTISLLIDLCRDRSLKPEVIFNLIRSLEIDVQTKLIHGEILDVQLSNLHLKKINEKLILDVIRMKTAALFEFSGMAGAMIGLNTCQKNHPWVRAISNFSKNCGIAFQLQDDILGVIGDERKLGKPVGSDIKEGKKTTIAYDTWRGANLNERKIIERILGKKDATDGDVEQIVRLFMDLGGINSTRERAKEYIQRAIKSLNILPSSEYKKFLTDLAHYIVQRIH